MLETCNCRQVHTDFADSIALLRIGALSPRPPLFQRVSHEIVFFADFAESLARNALFQKQAPVSTRSKNGKKSCRVFKKTLWRRSLPCKLRGRRIGFVSFEHLCLFSLRASSRCLVKACNCRSLETYLPKALLRTPKQFFKAIVETNLPKTPFRRPYKAIFHTYLPKTPFWSPKPCFFSYFGH